MTAAPPATRTPAIATPSPVSRATAMCGLAVVAVSLFVILGLLTRTEPLARIVPGAVTVKANSALGLLGLGVAIVLASSGRPSAIARTLAAAVPVAVGAASLAAWAGFDLRIDEAFVADPWSPGRGAPGRPSVVTAAVLLALGLAALPSFDSRGIARAALAVAGMSVCLVSVLAWAFGAPRLLEDPALTPAAVVASMSGLVCGAALLGLARLGILSVYRRPGPSGVTARVGLLTALALPLLVGVLGAFAEDAGLLHDGVGLPFVVAVGVVLGIVGATVTASRSASAQDRLDAAHAELRASEERYRTILDHLPDLVLAKDPDDTIVWANAAAERAFGVAAGGLARMSAAALHGEASASGPVPLGARRLREAPGSGTELIVDVQGEQRTMDVRVVPLEVGHGGQAQTIVVLTDVTAAHAARVASDRLAALVEASFRPILTLDLDGMVTSWNSGAEHTFGWSAEDVIGTPGTVILPPESSRATLWEGVREGTTAKGLHGERVTRSGRRIMVTQAVFPLHDANGGIAGTGIVMEDVSQDIARTRALRESEASLRRATQELARSNRALAEFASVASHDLREPLRKIRAFGDRLQRRESGSLSEEGRSDLGRMVDAAERLQAMISDMLDLARLPAGERVRQVTPLATLANEAVADLSEAIAATGASVEVGALPSTLVDPIQIRRVFQNLIGNALKFQPPGVPPRVVVGAGEPLFLEEGGAAVEVWVQDEGIGIDERFADRIFQPFERLHGRGEYEGTGMGLAICRTIVELHGGTIRATGEVGVGTRITLTLPLRAEALPALVVPA